DMRALATAVEAYAVDNNQYPPAACAAGIWTTVGTAVTVDGFTRLTPTYIAQPPKQDGWGEFFLYSLQATGGNYNIQSKGRDKGADTIVCGTTTDFNDDILYSNGTFVQWPEGTQQ
ncbi:MAG: type II secretion system protein GspG, partial [Thermoanaerobaculia bacterium]